MKSKIIKDITRWFVRNIRFLIPVILLGLAGTFYYLESINENYRSNLVTEIIGACITVIIVDYLYQLKDTNDRIEKEKEKIRNINNLIYPYINEHIQIINSIINPGGKTSKLITSIEISDLQYIYNECSLRFYPAIKNYQLYFESLKKLTDAMKQNIVLLNIDIEVSKRLVETMREFILNNDSDVLYQMIDERSRTKYGEEDAISYDIQFLKDFSGPIKYSKNWGATDIYIRLHRSIIKNMCILTKYRMFDKVE